MLNKGIVQLPDGFFPKLEDKWTDEDKQHMLIITGFDLGKGLSVVQSTPELAEKQQSIAYSEKYKAMINLYYPIVKEAINTEFVHARVISLLNNAAGEEESPNYKMTFVFLCDKDYKNFKLGGIFTGDTDQGQWVPEETLTGMAGLLSMPVFKPMNEEGSKEGK